ncbi:NAD(P)-dependent oxidoreductase [Rhodanobacter sp. L36]|uniref:NAD(P)-dependent oxidoreductase n=1 Tax=Rhodanobacter sp. L36 TaxID=1747221 RepID=UPI00131E0D20|nr:NAD(P)-dependent oxidoreductase [Rhodanobacter sp. L36]
MQRIALIGGTGNVGQRVSREARRRGHALGVVARHPDESANDNGVTFVQGDVRADPQGVGAALRGFDVLISASRFVDVTAAQVLAVAHAADIARVLVVGGAGSLEVAPGMRLVDSADFPAAYKPEALAGAAFLDALRETDDVDWTYLSPAAVFVPGERTGKFRIGGDALLVDAEGVSTISYEDFAVALLDEVETPVHIRKRFSVAY